MRLAPDATSLFVWFLLPLPSSLRPLSPSPSLLFLLLPVRDQRGSFTPLSSFHNTRQRAKQVHVHFSKRVVCFNNLKCIQSHKTDKQTYHVKYYSFTIIVWSLHAYSSITSWLTDKFKLRSFWPKYGSLLIYFHTVLDERDQIPAAKFKNLVESH